MFVILLEEKSIKISIYHLYAHSRTGTISGYWII